MTRQFSSAHTLRGPTAERKKSKTNWKNINKEPNPVKQEKAELKRERRRERNKTQKLMEYWGKEYPLWLYGRPSVRQNFKK